MVSRGTRDVYFLMFTRCQDRIYRFKQNLRCHYRRRSRVDQYEYNDRKLGAIPTNPPCDIATQSTRVNRSVRCFARLGRLSRAAQPTLVLWVARYHEWFIRMELSLWSLDSY
jgi:hypothetical protein